MEDKKLKSGLKETFEKENHKGHTHEHGKKEAHEGSTEREAEGKGKKSADCGCKYF